jgi:hypothetical protein
MGPGKGRVASSTKLNAPTTVVAAATIGTGRAIRNDPGPGTDRSNGGVADLVVG